MKIERLHIDNFGKLSNLNLNFNGDFNQLCNENGWGKTTLSIFIKAMFYGMSASRENVKMERKKYMPWQGGVYGGSIDFVFSKGRYRVVRHFGKTPEADEVQLLNLDNNKEIEFPKEGLGEWIFGVGKETFETTAFFPQMNITTAANEQISASVLGLDKFKFDLASVGNALTKIKKEISVLKKSAVKDADIERLKRQQADLKLDLSEAEERLSQTKQEISKWNKEVSSAMLSLSNEKESVDAQEKVVASKLKLQEQIAHQNETLSSLYTKLSDFDKEKQSKSGKISALILFVLSAVLYLLPLMLWGLDRLSIEMLFVWMAVCLPIPILAIFFAFRKKRNKDDKQEKKEIEQQIDMCKMQIESLKTTASALEGINQPKSNAYEEKQQLLFDNRIALEKCLNTQKSIMTEKERLVAEIDKIEDEIIQKTNQKQGIDEKILILEKTQEYLSKAQENVSERFVKPINDKMGDLLNRFDMRGRRYIVDTNFDVKEENEVGIKAFEQSSQGYQDIVSFCMRFLLIKEVFKNEKPFVVLDDTFVNLDDSNFEKAREILKEFAKEYQILYICCSQRSRV